MIKYDNRTQMAQFMFPHLTVTVSEDYNKPERQICNESDAVHFMYDLIYRKDTETLAVIMLDNMRRPICYSTFASDCTKRKELVVQRILRSAIISGAAMIEVVRNTMTNTVRPITLR